MKLKIKLKVKKKDPEAKLPTYATPGSACFDFYSLTTGVLHEDSSRVFHTGLEVEVPEGHVLLLFSRSGHGFKHGIRLSNCVGVIDSDFRGEIVAKLHHDPSYPSTKVGVKAGDRIVQGLVVPIPKVEFEEVEELSETQRGAKGFGSTGV